MFYGIRKKDDVWAIVHTETEKKPIRGVTWIESEEIEFPSILEDENGALSIVSKKTIADLYNEMNKEVLDQMTVLFETTSTDSAQRQASMWEAMLKRPFNYISENLGLLDQDAVILYATTKLNEADTYAVFVAERVEKFRQDRALILDE